MNPEATAELIWHFAGYLHIADEYTLSRHNYQEVLYHDRVYDYRSQSDHDALPRFTAPELTSYQIQVSYTPKYDRVEHVGLIKHHGGQVQDIAPLSVQLPDLEQIDIELAPASEVHHGRIIEHIVHVVHSEPLPSPQEQEGEPATPVRDPIYNIEYVNEVSGKLAELVQQNIAIDRDYFSDGGEEYDALHHVETGDAIPDMMEAAHEFAPDLLEQPGMSHDFWTKTVTAHDEAMASGDRTGGEVAPGRYVNGELQEQDGSEPEGTVPEPPALPERAEGETDPGQVAELGGNSARNQAVIADLNEAPATLVVMGDYYETNSITQANVFQNQDQIFDAGSSPLDTASDDNRTDNIATFTAHEIAKQVASTQRMGDLQVNVDFIDGDLADVKAITQRNFIDDGDVTIQTQYDSYSQVLSGANEQYNGVKFEDWGKNYDIIIVLGDYHSANIISQTNIVLDNDVVGVGSSPVASSSSDIRDTDSAGSALTGQNALQNEAAISKYGATTFEGITGDMNYLLDALGNKETLDRDAWSSFHGAASGSLNVLFVTGDYYDLNVISQVNVIADADLAVQVNGGTGTQWLSVGGNTAINQAEIINAGGLHKQYLGGTLYEDSMLVQANLVSDLTHTTQTNPTALVSELVAFLEHPQDASLPDGETWTSNTYSNHDTFGHVLS